MPPDHRDGAPGDFPRPCRQLDPADRRSSLESPMRAYRPDRRLFDPSTPCLPGT